MRKSSELMDTDSYLAVYEASEELAIIGDGELMLHQLRHPQRGLLTAVQAGDLWFVSPGDFIDRREDDFGEVVEFEGAADTAWRPAVRPSGVVVPFRALASRERQLEQSAG